MYGVGVPSPRYIGNILNITNVVIYIYIYIYIYIQDFPSKFMYPSCLGKRHSSQGLSAQKFQEWLPNTCAFLLKFWFQGIIFMTKTQRKVVKVSKVF